MLSRLTMLRKLPLRSHNATFTLLSTTPEGFDVDGLSVEWVEFWFVIKGVHVTWTPIHEEEDYGLGSLWQHGVLRGQRVALETCRICLIEESILSQHSSQSQRGKTATKMANRLATVDLTAKTVHWFVHNIWGNLYWKITSQSVDKEKFVKVQDQKSEPIESVFRG